MRNKGKKILGLALATMLAGSTLSLVGCGSYSYQGDELTPGYGTHAEVSSNGGFVVEKGDYVYFINGVEDYTANNSYGDVVKGALMRISKSKLNDLVAGKEAAAEMVVPSLFVEAKQKSGLYIYGDYVYYATPTTDKNLQGEVENSWVDVKRAKIDGTEAPESEFMQLPSTSTIKRFVTVDGVDENGDGEEDVFCLYEEDSGKTLKSFNTATKETTVLVEGSKSAFFYNEKDVTDPTVYYTMNVVEDADKEHSHTEDYDQVYSVNAAAKVEKYDAKDGKVSYTVKGGRTYSFDQEYFTKNALNEKDYTEYPYVNLGTLVVDGIGFSSEHNWTQFNEKPAEGTPSEAAGFNYTIKRVENDGVYFTKKAITSAGDKDNNLYYIPSVRAADWSAVIDSNANADIVLQDVTNTVYDKALYSVTEEAGVRTHSYFYASGNNIVKATAAADGTAEEILMTEEASSPTLWMVKGDYLYFYGSGGNGNNVSRINATGDQFDYKRLTVEEYKVQKIDYVDWNSSWFKPEFVGDVLMYSNAQSYGGTTAYNYISATKVGTTEEIIALNEAYAAYNDYKNEYSSNDKVQGLIKYFFMKDESKLEQAVIDEYDETIYAQIVEKFSADNEEKLSRQATFNVNVSRISEKDSLAMDEEWKNALKQAPVEEVVESEMAAWVKALIVALGVVVVAAAVLIPVLVKSHKKKLQKREEEATVNAYKRKRIDMTKDDTIDVYADEEATETEVAEEAQEKDE